MVEIHRLIREEDPPKPSTRLTLLDQEAITEVARAHREPPERLRRLVRGDLDWIVMRALEKDRNRRYTTASEFAEDVDNYLEDKPVEASPPSTAYLIGKFVRRNRAALTMTVLLTVALAGGLAATFWQAGRAAKAESHNAEMVRLKTIAERERERAVEAESRMRQARNYAQAAQDEAQWKFNELMKVQQKLESASGEAQEVRRLLQIIRTPEFRLFHLIHGIWAIS